MFTHVNSKNQPGMVNVGQKDVTHRIARAQAVVALPKEVISQLKDGDIPSKKGPVFQTAIIAGTMGAKKTSEMIPLCHPLPIEGCTIAIEVNAKNEAVIECQVETHHKTGVEMEALTGAAVAALTIYDMCKAFSHDIVIREIRLMEKTGGRSDFKR